MKIAHQLIVVGVSTFVGLSTTFALPVASIESAAAKPAVQQVDSQLSETVVANQLAKLRVTPEQARARIQRLDDAQLAQLAGQIRDLQAGGDIRRGYPHPFGPLGCFVDRVYDTISHVVKFLFCWTDVP